MTKRFFVIYARSDIEPRLLRFKLYYVAVNVLNDEVDE